MKSKIKVIILVAISGTVIYINSKRIYEEKRNYEVKQISEYKYFVYQNNDKYGVINTSGTPVIEALYDDVKIPDPSKDVFICYDGDITQVLNQSSQSLYTEYSNIDVLTLKDVATDLVYEKSVLKYKKDGKFGLIDLDGNQITKPIYDEINTLQYKEGEMLIKKEGKYGVINQNGYILVEPKYDQIQADTYYDSDTHYKYDGYIVSNKTEEGYRYGYISNERDEYLELKYNDIKRISEIDSKDVYLLAALNGRYGIFKENKNIIPNEYQSITFDSINSIFVVQKGKKYGVLSLEGNEILKCDFEKIDVKGKYLYATNSDQVEQVYDIKGKLTDIPNYMTIEDIPEKPDYNIKILIQEGKSNYQLYKGEELVTTDEYMFIQYLQNDMFLASKSEGKLGLIDSNAQEKLPFEYDVIKKIDNTNFIQLEINGITKVTDENANVILEMNNGKIDMQDEFIRISDGTETKYINPNGEVVDSSVVYEHSTLFAKNQDGKWGFVDKSGNMQVQYQYDEVTEFNEYGFAGIKKNNKWGVLNKDGSVLLEPTYEFPSQDIPNFIGVYYQVEYGLGQFYYTNR